MPRKACTCGRADLPLITTHDGITHCYPCMALDQHPLVGKGKLLVPPETVEPKRNWGLRQGPGKLYGLTWAEIQASVAAGDIRRADIIEP